MSLPTAYICIPQFLIQQGLKTLIEGTGHYNAVRTYQHVAEAEDEMALSKQAVLICDYLDDEGISGKISEWINANPQLKVLVITDDTDNSRIRSLLKGGVQGFLTKSCSQSEIIEALNALYSGETFYCNRVLKALVESNDRVELSEREMEVVKLIATGSTSFEIADELSISIHTVNSHRKNILKKLKLKSPTELIIFAVEQGWVSLERK